MQTCASRHEAYDELIARSPLLVQCGLRWDGYTVVFEDIVT